MSDRQPIAAQESPDQPQVLVLKGDGAATLREEEAALGSVPAQERISSRRRQGEVEGDMVGRSSRTRILPRVRGLFAMVAFGFYLLQMATAYYSLAAAGRGRSRWSLRNSLHMLDNSPLPIGVGGLEPFECLGLRGSFFRLPRPRRLGRLLKSVGRAAATTLHLARERVHVSSTRPEDEQGSGEGENPQQPKAMTCLAYDLGSHDRLLAQDTRPRQGPPYNGSYYYLGGNVESFLVFVQQELGASSANASHLVRTDITDLAAQKERFSQLWREGRLVVEDPNTLDLINNKTSFRELLLAYTTRMKKTDEDPTSGPEIVSFLTREYGAQATADAMYRPDRSAPEAMATLKALLEWFKQRFPYYKSACLHCSNHEDNRMIGVAFPSHAERGFNATLTEVYVCSKCHRSYRFPRSVVISRVMETRRGRCGEYSRLFFKAMEALNYKARWVVDWEDHVWVEVELPGRGWIHLDPCEAAVDEPLLYQSWGKNQTYILAFTREEVQDVTHVYTSDFEAAKQRRKVTPQEFDSLLSTATGMLREKAPPNTEGQEAVVRTAAAAKPTDRQQQQQGG